MRSDSIALLILAALTCLCPSYAVAAEDSSGFVPQAGILCDDNRWERTKKNRSIESYNEFLEQCPESQWALLAKHLVKSLRSIQTQNKEKKVSLSTRHDVDW